MPSEARIELMQQTIERQGEAITQALLLLEKAHQAAHLGDKLACLTYMAQAMEALANDPS